jgi:hypothetical protein
MGYAYSALLAPPQVANSEVLKPWRTAYRGPRVFALGKGSGAWVNLRAKSSG